jgi:glycosyltransferase involved in cell wall biosynthesis
MDNGGPRVMIDPLQMAEEGPRVLFVYLDPHPSHRGFAEAVGSDFWHYNRYLNKSKMPKILKSFVNGISLPRYEIYLTEGGAPLAPVAVKKLIHKNNIHVNIIADETFMMMRETPKEMSHNYRSYVNLAHKFASKYIDGAIAVSELAKSNAEEFVDIPIRIAHPYIEDELYKRISGIHPNIEGHTILSIGHGTYPRKGMDILIEAFKLVRDQYNDAELYIIGKGHPRGWNDIDGVHVEGYVKDLTQYFKNSSVFVQASRVVDTFPVATLESLRSGLPTIVTDLVGTKEVIQDLDSNFIRKVDAEAISEAILFYFDLSASKKAALSLKSKEISKKFNREEMCGLFRREFDLLLEEIGVRT